ncbi:MAG TPA: NAD(P)/FAD-dependent oxidoreductase [Candidatus Solibacter sp.]|nr:NAD(P)/FAD-dependent oxidoreductase [Candidatus Solibacter sp.]
MAEISSPSSARGAMEVDTLIIGGGFSGLCMAIKLREAGMNSFLLIEKSDDIGGTWYDNRYPGCACDIPSHLYSFSFELSPEWTRMYPGQQEIHAYLKRCVDKYGLAPHIRLSTRFCEAVWNEKDNAWNVSAASPEAELRIRARVLVSGMGGLHVPNIPKLRGVERFAGPSFHSSQWNYDVALTGKNVAVIGSGASAIQFVPQIAANVEKLNLFLRTPPWIVPRLDFEFSEKAKRRFRRFWLARWAFRKHLFLRFEIRVLGFLGNRFVRGQATKIAKRHLQRQIKEPKLRAALTPKYELGCKRVLVSDDFYPTLTRPNVELVTEGIAEVREHSIVTADGIERPVDVLISGTGFRATEPLIGSRIVGRGGVEIHDAWRERMNAYYGITVNGYPNFFVLLGPNTGLGHNSIILMTEAQVRYVISCLKMMKRKKKNVIEVREEKQKRFVADVHRRLQSTVWQTGGCRSWYQDARTGENTTLWPGSVIEYVRRTRSASAADYNLS